jgi:hypothetical protein
MADIGGALVTGGATIVGVVAGAGLTYWLGALNRRHQEEREDRTRWYEARREAYVQLNQAIAQMETLLFREQKPSQEESQRATAALRLAQGTVRLVGSAEAFDAVDTLDFMAGRILDGPIPVKDEHRSLWYERVVEVEDLARQDLGYPGAEPLLHTVHQVMRENIRSGRGREERGEGQ